jgi:hypothetical protein
MIMLAGLAAIIWLLPNTQELLSRFEPALKFKPAEPGTRSRASSQEWITWKPNISWALGVAALTIYALTQISRVNEFIYWQF